MQPIRITSPITVRSKGDEFMTIEPADHLIIDYTLDYPAPIGVQKVHFELTSTDAYVKEVAPARTFGFVRDFAQMNQMGLAMGGRLDNAIIVDDQKIVNTKLRFPGRIRAAQGARSDRRSLPARTPARRPHHGVEDRALRQPRDGQGDSRLAREN